MLCGYGLLIKYRSIFGNIIKHNDMFDQLLMVFKPALEMMQIQSEFNEATHGPRSVDQINALFDQSLLNKAMSPILGFRLGYFIKSLKELKQTNLNNLFDSTIHTLDRFMNEKLQ